jgi:hypothetical protein
MGTLPKVCLDQYAFHTYGEDGRCKRCGVQREKQKTERSPTGRKTSLSKAQIKQSLVLLLEGSQSVAIAISPDLAEDKLSPAEVTLLADALADEVNQSERLKKLVAQIQTTSAHGKLIFVLILIAAPRLARHGVIPAASIPEDFSEIAVALAAGATPSADRGNGVGQVDLGQESPRDETVPLRSEDEAGRDFLSSTNGHTESGGAEKQPVRQSRTKTAIPGAGEGD